MKTILPITLQSLSELTGLDETALTKTFINIHAVSWDVETESYIQHIPSLGYKLIINLDLIKQIEPSLPDASFNITVKEPVIEITNTLFNTMLFFAKTNWEERLKREAYLGEKFSIMYMPEQRFKIFVAEEKLLKRLGNNFNYNYVIVDLKKVTNYGSN